MENQSLLQSFARAKNGTLVSISETERGMACECTCPSCGGPLVAKQGDVRAWHFAHASGSECPGAAETTLHLAAKELIQRNAGIALPQLYIQRTAKLPDGRTGEGEARLPETWIDFSDVVVESAVGDIIPDVVGHTAVSRYLVEIAVTHFVDEEKQNQIIELGLPAIEIDLSQFDHETWDWDTLTDAVIHSTANKRWLFCPDEETLCQKALWLAKQDANAQPVIPPSIEVTKPAENRTRYKTDRKMIFLTDYPFGVVFWTPYDHDFNETIKGWCRELDGYYRPRRKNWLFPKEARPHLLEKIVASLAPSP